jgi:aryl-alcohol dehydrogenase-like predicted oxidoreductase
LSGKYRLNQPVDLTSGRPVHNPARFDPAIPENVTKLEVVEDLVKVADDIGATLPQLALAFTVAHPAVTSTIIGPRTMQQLEGLLSGASHALHDTALDRIDQIVPPGTNLYHPDTAWRPPALAHSFLRRRPLADRAAA